MKNIIIIISILFCTVSNAQTSEISKIKSDFETKVSKLNIEMKAEIKKLSPKNYNYNKQLIENKYSKLYNTIENYKNNKISELQSILDKKNYAIQTQKAELQNIENEKKIIEEEKIKNEEIQLNEIKLEKERQELQKTKLAEEKRKEFEKSDLGKIQKKVKTNFEAWMIKDEYETTEKYSNRITNESISKFQYFKDSLQKQYFKTITKSEGFFANYWDYNLNSNLTQIKFRKIPQYGYSSENIYNDSIKISIPIALSKFIKSKIEKPKNNRSSVFLIFPLEKKLVNNNYKITKLILILPQRVSSFDGFFYNHIDSNDVNYVSLVKENDNYFLHCGTSTCLLFPYAENGNYLLKDITPYLNDDILPYNSFYYIWEDKEAKEQNMDFTLQDLQIKIPTF